MDEHTFKLVMQRFDNQESLLRTYHEEVKTHVDADHKVHAIVARHATYWKLLTLGLPVVGTTIAKKFGWI